MTTTDSNGLVRFTVDDPVTPLQTALNLISSSVSNYIDGNVDMHNVPSISARDALATNNPPTVSKPLLVWVQSTPGFWLNQGTGWTAWPPPPTEIPEVVFPVNHYAGRGSYGVVAKHGATDATVTFGVTLDNTANWIPQLTLLGTRGNVDRLQASISNYTKTGLNVVVKNHTAKNATGGTILWALFKKKP